MNKTKTQPTVIVRIVRGPVTPAAKASWRRWWAARVAEVKREVGQ